MDIKTAVKIVEQMENDVESLCKCCMPKGAHCIGCRETAITTVLNELKKKDEVIDKLKTNWKELEKYIDNSKLILNNPNIFQYYLIQKEVLKEVE